MDVEIPRTLDDVLVFLAARPDAEPIAGGTDLMVEMNFGRHRPTAVVAIDRIDELKELRVVHGSVRMSAGVTYARMLREPIASPAMQQAARTVGSPQIRNAGTIGDVLARGRHAARPRGARREGRAPLGVDAPPRAVHGVHDRAEEERPPAR